MGVLTFGGVSRRVPSFIPRFESPIGLLGVAKVVCETTLFSTEIMVILGIQPIVTLFHLVTKLCENGGTLDVVFKLEDIFCTSYSFPSKF